jgi:hypothetical protein
MNAGEIVKSLLTLGTVLHDAYTKAQKGGPPIDWAKFLASNEFKTVEQFVKDVAKSLAGADVATAIAEIDKKQTALLKGRDFASLSTTELADYSALSRARLMLTTGQLQQALQPSFWQWATDEALPVLINIAPQVIALLL